MEKTEQWQQEAEVEETEEEEEGATVAFLGQQWEKDVTAVEEDEVAALALQGQQWEEEEEVKERDMDAAALALQGQQWEEVEEVKERDKDAAALALQGQQWGQDEVEEEEMVEVKEKDKNAAALALQGQQWGQEEVEEEKVDAVALQGRRPRRLTTTTAIEVSDASKIDLMLPSSEPANADGGEFQEQDTNDVVELVLDSPERSKKSVYSDKVQVNILALALANLIGGLFLIGHHLWELKNENSGVTSNQATEGESDQVTQQQEDRYQELLGRRENFWLHAPVTLLSFLIVGSLPPVIYAFTFPKSNNSDFKLIAVAVASLLCIILLAIGKAYIQRPPKAYIKTVVYYVIMGFMASGVSYAAADLIKMLLEKLGWFDSDLLLTLPEMTTKQPGWGSY